MRGRKQPRRTPHPDPGTEMRLQHIIALMRMRASCEAQVSLYQAAIRSSHAADEEAIENGTMSTGYSGSISRERMQAALAANAGRRREAEEGIREQRAVITSLQAQVEEAIEKAGLTVSDLAYLS